jgi:hypothetical protein
MAEGIRFFSGSVTDLSVGEAVLALAEDVKAQMKGKLAFSPPDLALVFISSHYLHGPGNQPPDRYASPHILIGCTAEGVIGERRSKTGQRSHWQRLSFQESSLRLSSCLTTGRYALGPGRVPAIGRRLRRQSSSSHKAILLTQWRTAPGVQPYYKDPDWGYGPLLRSATLILNDRSPQARLGWRWPGVLGISLRKAAVRSGVLFGSFRRNAFAQRPAPLA